MRLELTHPYSLFLLVLLLAMVLAYRKSLVDAGTTAAPFWSQGQRMVSLFLRMVILVLLVLAAAGLTALYPTQEKMLVLLVDESRSIDANARQVAADYLAEVEAMAGKGNSLAATRNQTPYAIIPFAGRVASGQWPVAREEEGAEDSTNENTNHSSLAPSHYSLATNIAAALEPAIAMVPPYYVPHVVILTDGNETEGDLLTAAVRSDVVISTVPLPAATDPEVQLAELRMPPQVLQGEPFYVEVVVQSNRDTEGKIVVYRSGFKVAEETHPLVEGENVFRFRQSVEDRRQVEFSATVEANDDTIIDNNTAGGLVFVGGKPRVLLVESEERFARDLASALREQDIEAEVRPPEGIPRTLDELENFDAIMLSNVPATMLTMRQMDLIRSYVSDLGGGLMMLGGEQSFGLGGYYKTPVEEILPVRSDFEKEKEKPSLAICLVIDRSGSMGGEKMELAKDAAKSAVELLTPRDFVSVIAFDHESYVIVPMQSASAASSIMAQISTIEAGGGTSMYKPMVDAYDQLTRASAKLKHTIVLTDGWSEPGDFEGIARQMVNSQITLSTVGVGDADYNLLQNLAEIGQGRYYACDDPQAIPQIFAKETMTASKSAINEQPFVPVVITPTEVLSGIAIDTAPPLLGFVVTRPKPTSQFILATETGEPLLVWWRYGLGMSVAFTSDAKSRWAAEWLTWPDFPMFWAQIIRNTMRKSDQRGTMIELARHDGRVRVTLDAVDDADQYVNRATGTMTVIRPDLSKDEIPLLPTAPGRYEAELPLDVPTGQLTGRGGWHLQMTLASGERMIATQSRGIMVGYPDELRLKPTNRDLLERVAASTGGLFDPNPEELFAFNCAGGTRTAWKAKALWPHLV
ncbi:MAG: VWA domain-containing protein, partial [Planctomycetaceae bacterium]|nr:VWA domain-containing protein [Planctomycetaceae bacterium]